MKHQEVPNLQRTMRSLKKATGSELIFTVMEQLKKVMLNISPESSVSNNFNNVIVRKESQMLPSL